MIRKTLLIFFLAATVFSTSGFSCIGGGAAIDPNLFAPITLNYWRVFDDSDSMDEIIAAYSAMHPNVTINYRKLRYEEYENELLQGFAEDRGPDIFSVHSTWVDKYASKLVPVPPQFNVGTLITTGTVNKRTEQKQYAVAGITPAQVRKGFVDVVAGDVIRVDNQQEQVIGLPLGLDTLALFYNKDIFDNAGITDPPQNWQQFQDDVAAITRRNVSDDSQLDQSAAAIGTAANVSRSFDILSAIMMQNGTVMGTAGGPSFDSTPSALAGAYPAADGLRFYTDFAYPGKEGIYTWNEDMPNGMEAFQQGRTAMAFGYAYNAKLLRTVAPGLRFGVVPLPQLDPKRPATAANYWIEGVSKKASSIAYAWDFVQFAAGEKQAQSYLAKTGKPTALRSLIPAQQTEEMLPFVSQVLYAKNWYHGKNPADAEAAFAELITGALRSKGGSLADQRARLMPLIQKAKQRIQYGW